MKRTFGFLAALRKGAQKRIDAKSRALGEIIGPMLGQLSVQGKFGLGLWRLILDSSSIEPSSIRLRRPSGGRARPNHRKRDDPRSLRIHRMIPKYHSTRFFYRPFQGCRPPIQANHFRRNSDRRPDDLQVPFVSFELIAFFRGVH